MIVCFDLETHLIEPGNQTPRVVCGGFGAEAWRQVLPREQALDQIEVWLADDSVQFVNQYIAFDFAVVANERPPLLRDIYAAYGAGRIQSIELRERLLDLADATTQGFAGSYSLAAIAERRLGIQMDKGSVRVQFSRLDGLPVEEYPPEAISYVLSDVDVAMQLYQHQEARARRLGIPNVLADSQRQARWSFAFRLMSNRGLITDPGRVLDYQIELQDQQQRDEEILIESGIMVARSIGGKNPRVERRKKMDVLRARAEQAGVVDLTPSGQTSTAAQHLLQTHDPVLHTVVHHTHTTKLLSTYIPKLQEPILHGRYNTLLETGRTSETAYNLQTMPRAGRVRSCIVPRPDYLFCAIDLDGAELRALAQVLYSMFGARSRMAQIYRDDPSADLHAHTAASILSLSGHTGWTPQRVAAERETNDLAAEARQNAKAANFGFAGGMGPRRFAELQAAQYHKSQGAYGALFTIEQATQLRQAYYSAYPEMQHYFRRVSQATTRGVGLHRTYGDERYSWCGYCDYANRYFQALVAYAMKRALYYLTIECQLGELQGCYPVLFVHDEIVLEVPEDDAERWGALATKILLREAQVTMPDIPLRAKPKLGRDLAK